MAATSLQSILDASSYYLGENGTPTTEVTKRTVFANQAKNSISRLRNWSWELKDGDAINYVYSATPTNGLYSYALSPSAGVLKNKTAIYTLKFTDQNGNSTYFSPVNEPTLDNIIVNGRTDNVFWLKGNDRDGYTLLVNAAASALPTVNVTAAWSYRYYATESDFVATTDTTSIPSSSALAMWVAAQVFFSYREQSQYQLAMQRYDEGLNDLVLYDYKSLPFSDQTVLSYPQSKNASTNFKTYY